MLADDQITVRLFSSFLCGERRERRASDFGREKKENGENRFFFSELPSVSGRVFYRKFLPSRRWNTRRIIRNIERLKLLPTITY